MTTLESYRIHKSVSKSINAMGLKARCVNNKHFDKNTYEVRVNASEEEVKFLLSFMWDVFDNKMINIVAA